MLDTCVWLDLAQPINEPLLAALEQIVHLEDIELLVPQIVRDELARNKPRIIRESGRSVAGALKRARSAVASYENKRKRATTLEVLMDVEHALGQASDVTSGSLSRIEKLIERVPTQATTDDAVRRASQRALEKKAPFHNGKNNFADALLVELYGELSQRSGTRFLFVTHNIHDFSIPNGDNRLPHPELASFFSRVKSRYFIKLADALRSVRYDTFEYALYDTEHFDMEPRRASEIHQAIEEFFDRVWYDRHMVLYRQFTTAR
ncbi:MAG TPA: PIN domain-containing protein [Xanthobacteraceae bacterium]